MTVWRARWWKVSAEATLLLLAIVPFLTGCRSLRHEGTGASRTTLGVSRSQPSPQHSLPPLPQLDENATIDDYLTYAQRNNPGIKSAFNHWIAALEKVPQAKSLPNPTFGYAYFIDSIETRVGPQQHRFELMQMIPFFGKLGLRGEAALAGAGAMRARYEQAVLDLLYRVKDAYFEYYYLGRAIQITEENVNLLVRLEQVASQRVRGGAAQQDMLKAQVELGKLRDRLESLRDMRGAVAARLNAELNRPINAPLPWPKDVHEHVTQFPEDQVFQWTQAANWELQALSFEIERNEKQLALARKEFWPDFGLGVGYIATGEARAGGMIPEDSGKDAVAAMVSVSLPLWRSRLHAGVREARAALTAAIEARQQKENMLLSNVRIALYKFNDAVRQIRLYGETLIPKATQALNSSEAGYRAGQVDFVNIIDSERQLLAFRLAYERALAEHQQRLAELEMLVGRPLAKPRQDNEAATASQAGVQPAPVVKEQL
jgi:cobalt-zinc-cadmium efflux system outer membrane protein